MPPGLAAARCPVEWCTDVEWDLLQSKSQHESIAFQTASSKRAVVKSERALSLPFKAWAQKIRSRQLWTIER